MPKWATDVSRSGPDVSRLHAEIPFLLEAVMPDSTTVLADPLDPTDLLSVLAQVKRGDFTARLPLDWTGGRRLALACSRLERLATADSLFDDKMILREIDVHYRDLCRALTRAVSAPAREETGASRA
jgi:hypothetical protein